MSAMTSNPYLMVIQGKTVLQITDLLNRGGGVGLKGTCPVPPQREMKAGIWGQRPNEALGLDLVLSASDEKFQTFLKNILKFWLLFAAILINISSCVNQKL